MPKKNKPAKFKLKIDLQCGACGALTHFAPETAAFPKFCPCCGAAMERFCLACHKKAEMFFEEWWPEEEECLRTYSPARRCSGCNAVLDMASEEALGDHPGYQN